MNLPNKITTMRIIMTIFIIIILLFPFDSLGISSTKLFINEAVVVDLKYFISGAIFIIAAISDFFDGYIAKKYDMVTDLGKILDSLADKFLVDSILIILAAQGLIHPIIPVIVVTLDALIDSIKKVIASKHKEIIKVKSNKLKSIFLMTGIILTLFNNLPFELINFKLSDVLLILSAVLSVYSAIQFYQANNKSILN